MFDQELPSYQFQILSSILTKCVLFIRFMFYLFTFSFIYMTCASIYDILYDNLHFIEAINNFNNNNIYIYIYILYILYMYTIIY